MNVPLRFVEHTEEEEEEGGGGRGRRKEKKKEEKNKEEKKTLAKYGVLWAANVPPEDGGRMSLRNAAAYEN